MTSTIQQSGAKWRAHSGLAIGVACVIVLLALMALSTTFVKGSAAVAADTAVEFAELNYGEFVVPALVERAVPIQDLVQKIVADPEGTGEELGRREDDGKPYSYATTATGTITEGAFGEVGLEVDGMPDGITVGIAIPPLGSATALRDAGTDLTFGDFVNQTEYQNVAVELNKVAAAQAYGGKDLAELAGSTVEVTGAFTWSSKTGGDVTHVTIVPVAVEETS